MDDEIRKKLKRLSEVSRELEKYNASVPLNGQPPKGLSPQDKEKVLKLQNEKNLLQKEIEESRK